MTATMNIRRLGLAILLLASSGGAWSQCNPNGGETGASSVVDLQGQGNFTCAQITGDGGNTMMPVPGFQYRIDNLGGRLVITWSATNQADKIFVTASGNGARCLYDFEPGATSGSFLEPADTFTKTTVVACYDGVDVAVSPPPEQPISTTTNCGAALPGLQTALDQDPNLITAIGIGIDNGLNTEGQGDGDYILAVCASAGQEPCVDQCRLPTNETYPTCLADPSLGELCLSQRACATSDELPTGNPDAPKYCWEFSHQVDLAKGTFIPPKEKESGVAYWEQYSGSTCTKVTTTYRGVTYSYWTPTGCP